jgi:hypothetical protein
LVLSGVARVVLIVALSAGVTASADIASAPPSPESQALNSVYFMALLAGRDPDAAVRKARFTVRVLMKDLGMSRAAAVTDATRFTLRRGGALCGGT